MIKLRDYQQALVDKTRASLSDGKKHLIVELPTGGGKTVIFSYLVSEATRKGKTVLILTDRTELLTGTGGTLTRFGVITHYLRAGAKIVPSQTGVAYVGMVQTLRKRIDLPLWKKWIESIDMIIIDETHKQEFNDFFTSGLLDNKITLGFTATPKRSGKQRQLYRDYEDIIHELGTPELVKRGFLVPEVYFGCYEPDMSGVSKNMNGDFAEWDMMSRFDKPQLYGGVVKAYQEHTPSTHALVFCVNIKHCIKTVREFNSQGISAKFIVSNVSAPKRKGDSKADIVKYNEKLEDYKAYKDAYAENSGDREEILDQWKRGEFKVLVNAGILTTGFDFPPLETVIVFRATMSEPLWLQMIGRGSRISENKDHFNILDFGGNASRLGGYRKQREWSLYHPVSQKVMDGKMKMCGLKKMVPIGPDKNGNRGCCEQIFPSYTICPYCGYVYPEHKEVKEIDLKAITLDSNGVKVNHKPFKLMTFQELEKHARDNGYGDAWICKQIWNKGGKSELLRYAMIKKKRVDNFLNMWR